MVERREAEQALCFVPEMLAEYLSKNDIKVLEPASFFFHGVCLLVDISGFTKLSAQFCDQGKAGIDDLQSATNSFMEQLVEIVYKFGGDIIKFAGDAIICIFSDGFTFNGAHKPVRRRSSIGSIDSFIDIRRMAGSENVSSGAGNTFIIPSLVSAEVIIRVMHCANLLTKVQTDKLTVHVAMSCGEMCFGILGGFDYRWECLISGPCIHQLSDCLDDAPSKHAVISGSCARTLKVKVASAQSDQPKEISGQLETRSGTYSYTLLTLPSGNCRIVDTTFKFLHVEDSTRATSKLNDENFGMILEQFVPVPIAEQLGHDTSLHFMAEIREVTTMFMKWDSYEENTKHRDLLELQPCFFQAQRILASTGAYLRQFLVDDKGCVLIACWGMPHLSYLDNAHRALTAAAQIRVACYQREMSCSFGITTGDVYCGTVGSALRMEYAAIGSVVNMAARLMCKANGGILIDDATFAHLPAQDASSVQKMNPIKVKGRDQPLQVYSYIEFAEDQSIMFDDLDIPQYCLRPLHALLVKMTQSPNSQPRVGRVCSSILTDLFAKPEVRSPTSLIHIMLIEGMEGSGCTSVVAWLKHQATEHSIPTCAVRLSKKDSLVNFGMWNKLFLQMMPKDLFLNNSKQCAYVKDLLRKVYPKHGQLQGLAALRLFGITCSGQHLGIVRTFGRLGGADQTAKIPFTVSDRDEEQSHSRSRNGNRKAGKQKTLEKELQRIFAFLLNVHPTLLIVGNIELADESSLSLLGALSCLQTRSVFVCTALTESRDSLSPVRRHKIPIGRFSAKREAVSLGSTVWAKEFRVPILQLPMASLITLKNHTENEINKMLCLAMGVAVAPAHVAKQVRDFSGGSYFWIRELLCFIKEHGVEQFLQAVGEGDADSVTSPVSSHHFKRSKSRLNLGRVPSASNFLSTSTEVSPNSLQKRVDNILLVRFGSLVSEEQRILRKSSIIGVSFATSVLYALLARHLQLRLAEYMRSLVAKKWLQADLESEGTYQFAHPHAQQVVYELTPTRERNELHQRIASHLASSYPDNQDMYFPLWFHFQHCNEDMALQYAVKAAAVMLETEDIADYSDCLELLLSSFKCAKNLYDVNVLQFLMNRLSNRVSDWTNRRVADRRRNLPIWSLRSQSSFSKVGIAPSQNALKASATIHMSASISHASYSDAGSEAGLQECTQLCEQIDLFCHHLSTKALELANTAATCTTSTLTPAPSAWQLALLNIRQKPN